MFGAIRYFLSDIRHWISRHRRVAAVGLLALIAIAGVVLFVATREAGDPAAVVSPSPAPRVIVEQVVVPEDTGDLGFPTFATKNTTRVSGADATADAAAVALAVRPSTGDVPGPDAVSMVDAGDWAAGIAAASLVATPIGAPILVTETGAVPPLTASALRQLDPHGSDATAGRQVFVIGAAASPEGYETLDVQGKDAPEVAAEIDRLRDRLAGEPDHIVVASSDEPAYAMPAAGWAARSGDPVLFAGHDALPAATEAALRRHDGVPVYVLGPESAIGTETMKEIEHIAPGAQRVGADGPVENAIAFARYADGSFGWNINDPGHGFVIANADRPLDAGVASPLSASGTWGPLLVAAAGASLPDALRTYLLDLKPGYADDPTRAVYNHVWLIGDTSALSVDLQAQVDELAEVAPVTSGSGASALGQSAGAPESQPDTGTQEDEPKPQQDDSR